MRLNYLQNGGHDQNVLNRFTEMEYNARFKQANNNRIQSMQPKFGKKSLVHFFSQNLTSLALAFLLASICIKNYSSQKKIILF